MPRGTIDIAMVCFDGEARGERREGSQEEGEDREEEDL